MASDSRTPLSHAMNGENGVISKGRCVRCFVTWIHQLIPPDMMMVGGSVAFFHLDYLTVTLDLMSDIYIRVNLLV